MKNITFFSSIKTLPNETNSDSKQQNGHNHKKTKK